MQQLDLRLYQLEELRELAYGTELEVVDSPFPHHGPRKLGTRLVYTNTHMDGKVAVRTLDGARCELGIPGWVFRVIGRGQTEF